MFLGADSERVYGGSGAAGSNQYVARAVEKQVPCRIALLQGHGGIRQRCQDAILDGEAGVVRGVRVSNVEKPLLQGQGDRENAARGNWRSDKLQAAIGFYRKGGNGVAARIDRVKKLSVGHEGVLRSRDGGDAASFSTGWEYAEIRQQAVRTITSKSDDRVLDPGSRVEMIADDVDKAAAG